MAKAKKFGTFGGVFTPSILTLVGVIMYLRLPWITGQMGLIGTLGIIFVAHIISGCTGLSVASIATDKRVETGGTYYIISRSLGLPIGGTLGWALFAGLSLSVSLYLIGFAEVFMGLIGMEITLDNIRIMGSIILLAVLILTFISTSLTIKTQYIILTIMVLSILSVFLGKHFMQPLEPQITAIPESLPWITLFAIFFPAVTGFEAGVAMSGDLKDARKAIPRGTIIAILTALVVYVALTFFFVYTVDSDKLVNDPNVLFNISLVPQLVMAGVLGATLSSALGSILGAPRILQAVANDRIAPSFLGKGFGASNEPRNALIFTYIIAQAGILIGELNAIARVVTIFFIITYGFLNLTYTIESWASSDFRPSFRIPRVVSIIGSLACIILMIQLDILALGIAAVLLTGLFLFLRNKELNLSSGDSRSSVWLSLVKAGIMKLAKSDMKSRNWRPNIIVFSGGVKNRPYLAQLAIDLVGKLGIFTNFELIPEVVEEDAKLLPENNELNSLINSTAETVFEHLDDSQGIMTRKHKCKDIYEGIGLISSVYGFSGFEPNTILMGWPKDPFSNPSFIGLLKSLIKQDYNLTLLKYDKGKGFGDRKTIDVWWQGGDNTLPLALHLVRFLTTSTKWRRAKVRIVTLCKNPRLRERYNNTIEGILADFRIEAETKVINNAENQNAEEIIKTECGKSSLVITDFVNLSSDTQETVKRTETIASLLGTTLFIYSDTSFDKITSLNDDNEAKLSVDSLNALPDISELQNIRLPDNEILKGKIVNMVGELSSASDKFINTCLENIKVERELFLDKLLESIPEQMDKCEFTARLIGLTDDYKANSVSMQIKELERGVKLYLRETETALKKLPTTVILDFDRDDYKKLKPKSFGQKLHRRIRLLRLGALNKKMKVRVKILPAANYYLYFKRLKAIESFYAHFEEESIVHLSAVREMENLMNNSGSGEKVRMAIESAKNKNSDFVNRYENKIITDLKSDISNFILRIQSPHANILSRRFSSILKKRAELVSELNEFPLSWEAKMVNQLNKIRLDLIYMNLEEKIKVLLNTLGNNIKIKTEQGLIKQMDGFEKEIGNIPEKGNLELKTYPYIPSVDICFLTFQHEVENLVEELEENITIGGNDNQEYKVELRKIADYYISNELVNKVGKESFTLISVLGDSLNNFKNIVKLANFTLDNESETREEEKNTLFEKRTILLDNIKESLRNEKEKVNKAVKSVSKNLAEGIHNAFDPLSSVTIIKNSIALRKKGNESRRKIIPVKINAFLNRTSDRVRNYIANLMYRQSEGLLWAGRLSRQEDRSTGDFTGPDKGVLELLPFYYLNLFTGRSGIGEEFWVGMEEETEQGKKAVSRFMHGSRGTIIITGDRRSGKSSLSKHLANTHFTGKETFFVRAPRESSADVALFEKSLYETIQNARAIKGLPANYSGSDSLEALLPALDGKCVVVIHDLELWWERKPLGTAVVERIIDLIQIHGREILFIINVNSYSLNIINSLTSLNSWALDVVECRPFPAKQLKEFIIARHKAGGLKFVMGNTSEDQMSVWDYARLFNHIFNLSGGNPGYAINLWLGAIKNISGDTVMMEKPTGANDSFVKQLSGEDAVVILQFILHRRFSISHLASLLMTNENLMASKIREMHQKGLLTEKYPGIYSLNPMLVPHLVKKLKSLELI